MLCIFAETKTEIMRKTLKTMPFILGLAAAAMMPQESVYSPSVKPSVDGLPKTPLTKKQKKARAASVRARKARKINRQ